MQEGVIPVKLNGSSRGGHESGRNEDMPERPARRSGRGRTVGAIVGAIACLLVLAVVVYAIWERPPEVDRPGLVRPTAESAAPESEAPDASPSPTPTEDPNAGAPVSYNENMFTFLVVGFDQVAYHTDTIMVGALDTAEHTIHVYSIPRDTRMNIAGGTKKINELVLRGVNSSSAELSMDERVQAGIDRMLEGINDILGFPVDVYAAVDLEAFVKLIDAIGGVDYEVPVDMYYSDPTQDLTISLSAGMHHLSGEEAIGVMRFRSGYPTADIGRIETQQDFLMSIASQFLSLGNIPKLGEFIDIFTEYVYTNMDASNLAFFARQFLLCSSEDIHFETIPANYWDSIGGVSYVSIYVNEWLEAVNEYLNPYSEPVTVSDVNILTHSSSGFYATNGVVAGGEGSFLNIG